MRHHRDTATAGRPRVAATVVAAAAVLLLAAACSSMGSESSSNDAAGQAAPSNLDASGGGASADSSSAGGSSADTGRGAGASSGAGSGAYSNAGAATTAQGPASGVDPTVPDAAAGRDIILTGRVSVEVRNLDRAVERVNTIAASAGGLVFGEETSREDDPSSVLTLKVPPAAFEPVLAAVSALGDATDRHIASDDVTTDVVDLDSRIESAQASVDRIRALMLRAQSISEISTIENELLNRETTLDGLRGQQRTLSDQVALATITVTLSPAPATPPQHGSAPVDKELPGFLDALQGGWGVLLTVGTLVGLVLAALAPWVPVALLVWLGVIVGRRFYRRRRPSTPAAGPSPEARREGQSLS